MEQATVDLQGIGEHGRGGSLVSQLPKLLRVARALGTGELDML